MTDEIRTLGTPGPGKGALSVKAMTACDCGCGLGKRFEFRIGEYTIMVSDPELIRAMLDEMEAGYVALWGEKTPSGKGA